MRIAYVTYAAPDNDPDDDRVPVLTAVRAHGFEIEAVVWDDPSIVWSDFDLAVVRSTWDYVPKYQAFRQWLINADDATTLMNPRMLIEPNLVKTYLRELEGAGIPIVPTQWISNVDQLDYFNSDVVIKPVISAGAADTIRTSDFQRARTHAESILASGRLAMAQPYLNEVDEIGEISIVCLNGQPEWAVRKIPALTTGGHGGARESVPLSRELREFALNSLHAFPGAMQSLYARVDVVPTKAGIRLMELELAEPSLFIPLGPTDAAERFAQALLKRL